MARPRESLLRRSRQRVTAAPSRCRPSHLRQTRSKCLSPAWLRQLRYGTGKSDLPHHEGLGFHSAPMLQTVQSPKLGVSICNFSSLATFGNINDHSSNMLSSNYMVRLTCLSRTRWLKDDTSSPNRTLMQSVPRVSQSWQRLQDTPSTRYKFHIDAALEGYIGAECFVATPAYTWCLLRERRVEGDLVPEASERHPAIRYAPALLMGADFGTGKLAVDE